MARAKITSRGRLVRGTPEKHPAPVYGTWPLDSFGVQTNPDLVEEEMLRKALLWFGHAQYLGVHTDYYGHPVDRPTGYALVFSIPALGEDPGLWEYFLWMREHIHAPEEWAVLRTPWPLETTG